MHRRRHKRICAGTVMDPYSSWQEKAAWVHPNFAEDIEITKQRLKEDGINISDVGASAVISKFLRLKGYHKKLPDRLKKEIFEWY